MSQVKISSLPEIYQLTTDDVLIVNDRNQNTSNIAWSNVTRTIERSNLNFTSSVAFDGNTRIGDFTYYTERHLRKYPGILITTDQITNWNEAYSWGNHADAGYLDGTYEPDQSDYAETDTNVPTFIRNKPRLDIDGDGNLTNVRVNLDYTPLLSSGVVTNDSGTSAIIPGATSTRAGLMTVGQFALLDSIELGAERNVQSNWDEIDVTSDAYILNKPTIDKNANGNITNVDVAVDYTPSAGVGTITVSSGIISDTADVNVVDDTNAGLMTSDQKGNLDILGGLINSNGNIEIDYNDLINLPNIIIDGDGNVSNIKVDLDYTPGATNGTVSITAGDNAIILGASSSRAGLISATDYDKLVGIEDGAEANVDPTQTFAQNVGDGVLTLQPGGDTTNIPVATTALAGLYPPGHYNKVEGAEDGAQANVQSDWNQIDTNADDYIQNKPDVPAELDDLTDVSLSTPQGGQVLMYSGAAWTNTGLANTINYGGVHDFIDSDAPAVASDPTVYIHMNASADSGNVGFGASDDSGYLNIVGDEIKDGDRVLYDPGTPLAPWIIISGITDTPQTNLAYNQTTHEVSNDNGTGFTLPLADVATDGLMSASDFTKLDGIDAGAEVNVDPSQTYSDATRTLTLSPGGDTTVLPLATDTIDGLMSASDFTKLDGIDAGAEINVDPTQAYTPAANKGTLTLTPGGDTTDLPIVNSSEAGLATPAMLSTTENITIDGSGQITNVKTSLSYTADIDKGTVSDVTSDTVAEIPLAGTVDTNLDGDNDNAGLVTAAQAAAIDTILDGTLSGETNLAYTPAVAGGTVTSDTGTDADIPVVDDTNAGLMIANDKEKLDKITLNNDGSVTIDGQNFFPGKATTPDWTADPGDDGEILNKPHVKDSAVTNGSYLTQDSIKNDPNDPYVSGGIVRLNNEVTDYGTNPNSPTTTSSTLDIDIPVATDNADGLLSQEDKVKYDGYNTLIGDKLDDAPNDGFSYGRVKDTAQTNKWGKVLPYDFTTLDPLQ